ncbi:VOC family protein [Chitinophaga barathri]|uniref:VOC family protein n=1 Tax=Chitinophaga barathri TaxID=1647451 RepID=A0A3N4M8F5_9BACT|nr:VOC family protein [Chitinophaga barathri]RPD39721.1 VOC family protein [Chitinophaga barathri]
MRLRVARHTTNLQKITAFYQDSLGLEVLGSFENHQEYDGVFLGIPGENWHLEFTMSPGAPQHHPDEDDLLVFYVPEEQYPALVEKVRKTGAPELPAKNPYWNNNGTTFADPDGFRFVVSKLQ